MEPECMTRVEYSNQAIYSKEKDESHEENHTTNGHNGRLVSLDNPNLNLLHEDVLYHLGLNTGVHNFRKMFGDVKFVCVGGSGKRMRALAEYMMSAIEFQLPTGQQLLNIAGATDRYSMYKVGPVLLLSHGIGMSSFSVMMHELIKLLHYAKATDVCCFRLGTCGGLGVPAGTVVVSTSAVNAQLHPALEMAVLGKIILRDAHLSEELQKSLLKCSHPEDKFQSISGITMCANDFYEGQARLDGAFCEYNNEDKMAYLHDIHSKGVRNIEMESLCFAAMCHKSNIQGAVVCVTILDRLETDQISASRDTLHMWEMRPAILVSRLIRQRLGLAESKPDTHTYTY